MTSAPVWVWLQLLLVLVTAASRAMAAPVGVEAQVNSYSTGDQQAPAVAARPDGTFVVVWDSEGSFGNDDSLYSVQARFLNSVGAGMGQEFQVNELTNDAQYEAAVASRPDGSFVVAWEHFAGPGVDPADLDIRARPFDSVGAALSAEFTVNAYTDRNQDGVRLVVREDSSFVAAWSGRWDGSSTGVHVRSFSSTGVPLADPVVINEYTASQQRIVDLAPLPHGGFVAAWQSYRQLLPGFRFEVVARELDEYLVPTTSDVMMSSAETIVAVAPIVTPRSDGEYVVLWHESVGDPVRARRMASGGVSVGAPFDVSFAPAASILELAVTKDPDRDFVVAWQSGSFDDPGQSPDGDGFAAVARIFGDTGPRGDEFVLSTYTTGRQMRPALAYGSDGRVLAVWQSQGGFETDTDGYSIQARFIESPLIFVDGFESGDFGGWSTIWPEPHASRSAATAARRSRR